MYRKSLLALAVASSFPALAQQAAETSKTLDTVVVSATRTPQSLDQVSASISVVTQDDFDSAQASRISDVMRALPNVDFGGGPRGNGEVPRIRGYAVPSVSMTIDGARQNWGNTNSLRSSVYIDPYFISSAEVLRGSASSLYGPGAVGGAMAFKTISASDFLEQGKGLGGGARIGYSGADRGQHLNAKVYGGNESLDALLAIGHHDWGTTIRQGGGTELTPNDGQATNALLKMGANIGQNRIEVSHLRYNSDNLENNNPQADSALAGAPAVQQMHTQHQQTVLKASNTPKEGFGYSASIYENDTRIIADRGANATTQPYSKFQTTTLGGNVMGTYSQINTDWRQRIAIGLDYYRDRLSFANSYLLISPPLSTQEVSGVYLQDEITLGAFSLTPSVRYDTYTTHVDSTGVSTNNSHVSPKLALAWEAQKGLVVYGSYGEAFRAPTITEMYNSLSTTAAISNFLANPNLKPETNWTKEVGAKLSRKNIFLSEDDLRLRISLFDSKAKDLIASVVTGTYARTAPFIGTGSIFQSQNISNASRRGGEAELIYTSGNWRVASAYSRIRVTDNSNGNGLFSPPDKLSLQVRRQLPLQGLSVTWNTTGIAAQDYDATTARRRPGYSTHDLFLSWSPTRSFYRIDLGMTNLSDKRYSIYESSNTAAYTYMEGRSLKAALNLEF